jgi:hypothetical protein
LHAGRSCQEGAGDGSTGFSKERQSAADLTADRVFLLIEQTLVGAGDVAVIATRAIV